jgi:Phage derived protein Gp49-like (DUF891)
MCHEGPSAPDPSEQPVVFVTQRRSADGASRGSGDCLTTTRLRPAAVGPRVKLSLKSGGVRGLDCEGHRRIRRLVHCVDQARSGLGDPGGAGRGRAPRGGPDARPSACGPAQSQEDPPSQGVAARIEGTVGIRIIFAFDPTRSALLLLGGDKAGNWTRWYRDNIPLAEQLYIDYTADEGE